MLAPHPLLFLSIAANTWSQVTSADTLKYYIKRDILYEGIGMDTCVIPLRHGGLSLVQTTDYIYPIVDDPYMMVRTFPSSLALLFWFSFIKLLCIPNLYVINFHGLFSIGKNCLCQCSK